MKKQGIIISLVLLFITTLIIFGLSTHTNRSDVNNNNFMAGAETTNYYDFSKITTLDPDYSYSSVFYSENTEFRIIKSAGTIEWKDDVLANGKLIPSVSQIPNGQVFEMLITNSGVNKMGQSLDVLLRIDNVNAWNSEGYITIAPTPYYFLNSQVNPHAQSDGVGYDTLRKIEVGDLLLFLLHSTAADCNLTIEYYISGTYDETTHIGVPGNVTGANAFIFDLDVTNTVDNSKIFKAQEGFAPQLGQSDIYYNKDNNFISTTNVAHLQELNNGIAIKDASITTEGIWYATSAFMVTRDLNSVFKFRYGGQGAGIRFAFVSPYPYDISAPLKSIDSKKEEVTSGDSFVYEVKQFIPNNYYGSIVKFNEIYSNLYNDTRFKKLLIEDTISNYLNINNEAITVVNESGLDVTNKFVITVSGQKVTATAKTDNFQNSTFYNHTYILRIPVSVKKSGVNVKTISNVASTTSSINSSNPDIVLNTNEAPINVYYNVTVKYIDEYTNKPLVDDVVLKKYYGDKYDTEKKVIDGYDFSKVTGDSVSGTVSDRSLKVVYYYKRKAVVNVNHYLLDSNGENQGLVDSSVQDKHYNDTYETVPSDKINYDYYYLRETPSNATGTVTTDSITVDYYYVLKRGDVLVHHYIEDTEEKLADDEAYNYEYGSRYETHENTERFEKNYVLSKIEGDPAEGTVEKEKIEVIYYYKLRESVLGSIIVKEALEEINDYTKPITYKIEYNVSISDYEGDATVKIVDKLPFKIDIEKSEIAEGTYDEETQTITWEEGWSDILVVEGDEPATKKIEKTITLSYLGVDVHTKDIYNEVIGTILLSTIEKQDEIQTHKNTKVKIPSKIVIHYYEEGTTNKLHDDEVIEGYVDDVVTSKALEIDGYSLYNEAKENKHTLGEKETEYIYYYLKPQNQEESENPETSKESIRFILYLIVLFFIVLGIYNLVIRKKLHKI